MKDNLILKQSIVLNSVLQLQAIYSEAKLLFIIVILFLCLFYSNSIYAAEITYDENGIIHFKSNYKTSDLMHNKINAYLSEMDSVLAKISKETDYELSNFFNSRKTNIKAFAKKASSYWFNTNENRRQLRNLFNECIFSENDIKNLIESLLETGSKKLQKKFLEILYDNGVINIKNTDLNNLNVNHQNIFIDTSYMDKNKFNTFCKVAEFAITIPLNFVQGMITQFLFNWLPYNQYKPEDEISRSITNQIDSLKVQIYNEIAKRFKGYNENLKEELKELLIKKFDE